VNTYPILVVNDRYESAIADAANHQLVGHRGPSLSDRVATAAEGLRRFLANDSSTVTIPTLRDYPYRS
jgi:hypothetical protein